MILPDKELAFLDLATDILKIPRQKRAFYRDEIADGHEFAARFWERIIANLARTTFTDVAHWDFKDMTEAKTASTRTKSSGSIEGQISNVSGKIGWIRVALYNHYLETIDFFLLPPNHKCKVSFSKACGTRGSIRVSYNRALNTYSNNLELYRVPNVQACCKMARYLKDSAA